MPVDPQRSGEAEGGASGGGEDPLIEAHVERAIAPYRAVLPPEALEELRELMVAVLLTHPEVAPVLDRLRRRSPPDRSGARPKRRSDGG